MVAKIIAEIGVNHNGDLTTAKELIIGAKNCGADIVKFQYFKTKDLVAEDTLTTKYQEKNTGLKFQSELLKNLEISLKSLNELKKFSEKVSIEFLCTSFSPKGLIKLCNLGMKKIKIPSGEINNKALLINAAKLKKEIYLSTGMAKLSEIKTAVKILEEFKAKEITLMHCTSLYPAPSNSLNINALKDLKDNFNLKLGYSDHSIGSLASCLALSLGATVLEKHITLDKNGIGPDHKASMNIKEFENYINDIKETEKILGKDKKCPDPREIKVKKLVRKSWYYSKNLREGEKLNRYNAILKRPEGGLSPLKEVYGKKLTKNVFANKPIKYSDII